MIFVTILLIWSDILHIRTTLIQEITFLKFSIVCTKANIGEKKKTMVLQKFTDLPQEVRHGK